MSLLAEIEKLKAKHFLFGLIGFLGTIGPGFLLIYHYHPELVEKYDIGKLILFASALTFPFFFANLLTYILAVAKTDETVVDAGEGILFGAFASTFTLNLAVMIGYFEGWRFRTVVTGAGGFTGLILIGAFIYAGVREVRRARRAKKPTS